MHKRHWGDLSGGQKIAVVMFLMVDLALLVIAMWDLWHRDPEEIRGNRRMWTGLVLIDVFGPLAYFTVGRKGFCQSLPDCCGGRVMSCCCAQATDTGAEVEEIPPLG